MNENNGHRGLHVVVISPITGKMQEARCFDTYESCDYLDEYIEFDIAKGDIVVAACQDDCMTAMSQKVKDWFKIMGSK